MNWLPISELTKNDIGKLADTRIGMPSYLISDVQIIDGETVVTFTNNQETYRETSGYIGLSGSQNVKMVRNLESGIIHATINGRCLCGVRHSQDSETVLNQYATCERCVELINK